MKQYYGTVFKSGNSFAIRVPIGYAEAQQLKAGEKVVLPRSLKSAEAAAGETAYAPPAKDAQNPMPEWD